MHYILRQLSRSCAHTVRLASLLALLLIAAMWSLPAAAAVSPFCPTQTLTVPKGGSVTSANLATCDGPLNLGMIPATPNPNPFNTAHGSVIVNPCCNLGGNQFATYTHNSDTATSDTFQLEDENGDLLTFNVTITAPTSPITVSPASLPAMTAGAAFSQTLTSSGGVGFYTYALQSGTLPVGLTLTSGGVLSGTPTQRGLYAFTIRSTDTKTPAAQFADKGYNGSVANPVLTLTSPTGTAIQNVAFSQTLTVSGGVAPYTCLLETGTFPAGIAVSNLCVVSGTTAAATGNYPVTIRVTESSTGPGSYFEVKNYALPVAAATVPGAPTIGAATPGNGAASITFTAPGSNGGSAIIDYTVTCNVGGINATGPASPINVTGLTNGTTYSCSVKARNLVGSSPASGAVSVTPQGTQTITFNNPGAQNFGTSPTLTATATSGLTLTFTSTTTGVCTITSGGVLSFVTTGACSINANQAGNAAFLPAATVTQAFNVNAVVPGAPTIGAATSGNGAASIAFTAPGSNGGSAIIDFTVTCNAGGITATGPASPINVTGLTNGTGYTCSVTARNSVGSGSASGTVSVTPKASQTITFTNPGAQNFGTSPTLTATATSSLTPTFTSTTTGVCTITSGGVLSFVTTGTCSIDANQAGNAAFLPAVTVTQGFNVNAVVPGAPTIGAATPGNGAASIAFTAPGSNGGSAIIDYTVTCSPSGTATGAGSPINVTGLTNGTAYTCSVTARNSVGSGSASGIVSVTPKASQTITFNNPGAQVFGTSPTLTATASSTLTPTFSSTTTGVCTITSGGVLSFVTTGSCSIDANQVGDAAFLAATTVTRAFNVIAANQTVTFAPATPVVFGVAPITLTATATSGLTAFTFATTTPLVCTVAGSTLTIVGTGSCALTATQAGNANFNSASAPATIVVNAAVPGAPTIGTTLAGLSQVSIAFTAPASNGGAAITSYTASCTPGGFSATGTTSPLVVTGLTTGTTYDCSVVATNVVGSGAASAIATVTPSFRTYTGSSPTGSGSITASFTGGGAACTFSAPRFIPLTGDAASPPAGTAPAGVAFPFGLFDFSTTGCTPGSTINMTVVYSGPVDFSAQYWKYGPTPSNSTPNWYLIPSVVGQNSISFSITDGGLGDDDLTANGTIVDQGGVGIPPPAPVPTLSSAALLLMVLTMFGIGWGGLGRKRMTADAREAATR